LSYVYTVNYFNLLFARFRTYKLTNLETNEQSVSLLNERSSLTNLLLVVNEPGVIASIKLLLRSRVYNYWY
jgi:hypothetical protein